MPAIGVEFPDEASLRAAVDAIGRIVSKTGEVETSPEYRAERALDGALLAYEQSTPDGKPERPSQPPMLLVSGTPADGFKYVGPVIPNDPDLDDYVDRHLRNEYWWYVDLRSLAEARAEDL